MAGSAPEEPIADVFMGQRGRLVAIAYRMLGSRADAEDAVQEAWLRLSRQDAATIHNLAGWLTTVVGRVCIDVLRSRNARPEVSYEDELPQFVVTHDNDSSPEDQVLLADSVGLAVLVVLDTLGPAERLAFILRDMFSMPFQEIGQILGKSTNASKMLASRARRKVRGAQPRTDDLRQQRAVVDAFLAAAREGDFEGLLRVLDPNVMARTHTAHGVIVKRGVQEVATTLRRGARAKVTARRVLVDGRPGIVAWSARGKPLGVMACAVVNGRIVEIVSVTDPKRLAALDLPGHSDHSA